MQRADLDLYTDYLLSTFGAATATGLSAMVEGFAFQIEGLNARRVADKGRLHKMFCTLKSIAQSHPCKVVDPAPHHSYCKKR
jgi:hypothetical protein